MIFHENHLLAGSSHHAELQLEFEKCGAEALNRALCGVS